jgi:hypothetical protein
VVVVLADADDVGVRRLVSSLRPVCEVSWWRFGHPETTIAVDADQHSFCLEQQDATLSSADLARADLVIYKRRLLQPRPLVASTLAESADREFSEREWTALVEGLLLAEESRSNAIWMNSPSSWALTSNKLALLLRAGQLGLSIPHFTIGTTIDARETDVVTKAISANEVIDPARYFSTTRVPASTLRDLSGRRLPTPAFLQDYVAPARELRAYYILGCMLTIALTPSTEHVDIRYASAASMAPTWDELPAALDTRLRTLARVLELTYCVFDLIEPASGDPLLVDITPVGGWDYFESEDAPFISDALAVAISEHLEHPQVTV